MDNMKGALGNLMRQAQQMQDKVQNMQKELAEMEIIGESGAGLVKVTMNGRHETRAVTLSDDIMSEDKDVIEDLIAAAVNDAVQRVERTSKEKMSEVTGGLNLPPGMNIPGMS